MRQPYCILSVVGDVLDDGELCFVEAVQTLDAAKERVQSLAELCPGQYVIYDEGPSGTGTCEKIDSRDFRGDPKSIRTSRTSFQTGRFLIISETVRDYFGLLLRKQAEEAIER